MSHNSVGFVPIPSLLPGGVRHALLRRRVQTSPTVLQSPMKRFSSLRGNKKRKEQDGRTGRRQSEPHGLLGSGAGRRASQPTVPSSLSFCNPLSGKGQCEKGITSPPTLPSDVVCLISAAWSPVVCLSRCSLRETHRALGSQWPSPGILMRPTQIYTPEMSARARAHV